MLDPTVRDKLRDRFRQLEAEGKIVPRAQLDQYFATFRARFGPDRLAALDGEPLLEAMHGQGGKDSLAYWLEFKNDDEFPALFGSIAGGSALKFGVFKRKATGLSVSDLPLKRSLTVSLRAAVAAPGCWFTPRPQGAESTLL